MELEAKAYNCPYHAISKITSKVPGYIPALKNSYEFFFDNFLSYQQNTINFPYPTMVQNSFKKFYIRIQNPMTSKINGNFLVQRYISSKIFIKIRSVVFLCEIANRQTNTHTPGKTLTPWRRKWP